METKTVKFLNNEGKEFIVELRKEVANYFKSSQIEKYGNFNLWAKTAFMFLLYITPYVIMITGLASSLYGVWACWVIIGVGKAGVGMDVMHDANHRSYSTKHWLNQLLGKSLYLLGGFPPNWQHQHNTMHHGFTNIEGYDEDIDPGFYLRLSPHKPLLKMHRFQHIYAWFLYGLMTLLWVTTKDFKQLLRYKKEGVPLSNDRSYTGLLVTLIISKIIYYVAFIVVPMLILPFAWYWIVVFFLSMHFASGFILTVIFQTAHVVPATEYPIPDDMGTIDNNWAIHQMLTTSDFAPKKKVISWLIGGLNYQVEHHLFPNISHVHYPKIAGIVKDVANKYGVPYHVQPGFLAAVFAHAKMLKNLGRA